jgi:hypothetical protein
VFVWFLGAVALAYSSSAQTDPRLQAYFSAGLVLAMFIFKRMDPGRRVARIFFLGIATFITVQAAKTANYNEYSLGVFLRYFFEPRGGLFSTDF